MHAHHQICQTPIPTHQLPEMKKQRHSSMELRTMSLLLLLLVPLSVAAVHNDETALLAFKAAAASGGSDDPLAQWNGSRGGYCSWEGVRCRGRHQRVVAISLPSQGLTGVLSPAIGNLSSLRFLNLSSNKLTGDIPETVGRLHRLRVIDLSYNGLYGELPANISSCASLKVMDLHHNQLYGCVPYELGSKRTPLELLDLSFNNLTGVIPTSLSNFSSLIILSLAFNKFEGTVPDGIGANLGLLFLGLAFNNLSGELPDSLYNISSMREFQLQGNLLHGSFPADIGSKFPDILILSFDRNQFTGSIPSSLSNLSTLQLLDLSENRLTGYVPQTLGRLRALQRVYLHETMLEANDMKGWEFITSMSNCSQLQVLDISINPGFTGPLPSAIVNLSSTLQILQLEYTGISSSIPDAISNLVNLEILHVGNTLISGVLPESIGKLGNLAGLYLYNTNLSGLIPASIGNLSKLSSLHAYNCNFVGAIPSTLGKLNSLEAIDLSINRLSGSIPREIFNLPALSMFFSLSQNLLSGPLPSEVGNLVNLNSLSLYGNQLSGEIPDTIGRCTVLEGLWLYNNSFEGTIPDSLNNIIGLRVLNLSINKLSGYIPDSIGGIRDLQRLGLAHNHLSGPIPTNLQNLTSLIVLDLSFNNLQGEVPRGGIFKVWDNLSITGNDNLCGGIPQLHLHPCHASSVENNRNWRSKCVTIALSTAGTILFLLLISTCIKVMYKKVRKNNDRPYLPSVVEEQYERVSYQALANGTNKFSEANLVGKGSFGAVYKCTFHDEGTIVAVKVFDLEKSGSSKSFVAECEALRRVRHRCLLKIITCCSSINHLGQEFKALVFEYMPNGSLSGWLHQESATPTVSNTLSLEQRLDIAIDIMDALDYLHNRCQPQIIHCDVKPSNILIAEDMSARVGDFGISRMLVETTHNALSSSISTVGIRGSIGYVAPEYGEGSSLSSAGDVYSLGILLLEMFTGRSPTNDMFRGSWDLHKFCEDALPRRILDIVDTTLWLHTVIRDNTMRSTIENCLLSVISLGISCSQKQPKERTPIQDAAIEMHAIRDLYLKSAASVVQENSEIATESADL